jgi:hypothetical protein
MKITWIDGLPKINGIYWIDIRFKKFKKSDHYKSDHPALLQVFGSDSLWYFNNYGSGPFNCFYNEKFCSVSYAEIDKPKKWVKIKDILGKDTTRAWVKTPSKNDIIGDLIGFAILRQWSDTFSADIIWLNNPNSASDHGGSIREDDGYLFCPVENPILK